jgi:type I restriction enzyme R subunit
MSELLDALILQRKQGAIDYKEYLAKIVALTKKAKNGSGGADYPATLNTPAKRALYDNLGKDAALAMAIHDAVQANRMDDWRGNPVKVKKVKYAIKGALKSDEPTLDKILALVEKQDEY